MASLAEDVRRRDRTALGRAITLVESTRPADEKAAEELLAALAPHAGRARRIGISGVPGAGKSTFIERLGLALVARGHVVAVLAVDPSSPITGGSLLGDRTRMTKLSREENAFIRPSPTGGALGGVTRRTRETLLVCEASGHDVVIVETVGVGQSEADAAALVDFFLLLVLPGSGDELQGIKRGILERTDLVVVNKADGERVTEAEATRQAHASALRLVRSPDEPWQVPVLAASAREGTGLDAILETIDRYFVASERSGRLAERRRSQRVSWMWTALEDALGRALRADPGVAAAREALETKVAEGAVSPAEAARALLRTFRGEDR